MPETSRVKRTFEQIAGGSKGGKLKHVKGGGQKIETSTPSRGKGKTAVSPQAIDRMEDAWQFSDQDACR